MARASIHTIKTSDGWANQRPRSGTLRPIYKTRAEARHAGEELARREHTEHVLHLTDGKIQSRVSFD